MEGEQFICPITSEYMRVPVQAADGFSYELSAIQAWFDSGDNAYTEYVTSPRTNLPMTKHLSRSFDFYQNYRVWCERAGRPPPEKQTTFGLFTIPTLPHTRLGYEVDMEEPLFCSYNAHVRCAARDGDLEDVVRHMGRDIEDDNMALAEAAEHNYLDIVTLLLNHGIDVHAGDDRALKTAAKRGHTHIVRLLLDRGANLHAEDDEAFKQAVVESNLDTVQLLIQRGVDPLNDTAYQLAVQFDISYDQAITRLLQSYRMVAGVSL